MCKMGSFLLFLLLLISSSSGVNEEYDFIIVGAGTAGCLLANRLSRNPSWRVLLVEAGGEESIVGNDIPGFVSIQKPTSIWSFYSEPSINTRRMFMPRGKGLGGTSIINGMHYFRGNPTTFNRWQSVYANQGWSFTNIEPYFRKFENFSGNPQAAKIYGTTGELHIEENPYHTEFSKIFLQAVREYGLPVFPVNPFGEVSFARLVYITKNGLRMSSNRAFLQPIKKRPNLNIMTHTIVRKILLNQTNTSVRAFGIEYQNNLITTNKAYARKEVILCAGVINTPKLLMLSGIGPKDHLNEMQIPVIRNLPVGDNLLEHPGLNSVGFTTNITLIPSDDYSLYLTNRSGPLSIPYNLEIVGITDVAGVNTTKAPNIEFSIRSMLPSTELLGHSIAQVIIILQQPTSRGAIRLRSLHPLQQPNIILNLLSDPLETETLLHAIRQLEQIIAQPSLQKIGAKITTIPLICQEYLQYSDEYYRCLIRQTTLPMGHLCGTCKMGPENDTSTVVDSELRVHGVDNLRVMDSSVFPEIITGHLEAAVLMVAEKGADLINTRWSLPKTIIGKSLNKIWTEIKNHF